MQDTIVEGVNGGELRVDHPGAPVKRFGYIFDPLFLLCCALYALNRWWIRPHTHIEFFHSWFNDTLLIPCALPPLLLAHRQFGLRPRWGMPTLGEIAAHWAGWSILFEGIGPHIMRTVGDPWDVVAYAGGAIVAAVWWRIPSRGAAGFDFLARPYRGMERLLAGGKMQRCRTAFLDSIPAPSRVLLVGEGHGRFLVALRRAFPQAQCLCVDASQPMLECAREAIAAAGLSTDGIEFVQADILAWTPPMQEFDLVVTDFVLDCFRPEQLEGLVARLAGAIKPGGRWLLADFCEPPSGLAKWRARAVLEAMYLFFGWATALPADRLTPPDPFLTRNRMKLRERRFYDAGLMHSDMWEN